jgi:hypothetical protein
MKSTDSINWNTVDDTLFQNYGNAVCARKVAEIKENTTLLTDDFTLAVALNTITNKYYLLYSYDQNTWLTNPSVGKTSSFYGNGGFNSIAYNGKVWVGICNHSYYSSDGINWLKTPPNLFNTNQGTVIEASEDMFVAGTVLGNIFFSYDGIGWSNSTWVPDPIGNTFNFIDCIKYNGLIWILAGHGTGPGNGATLLYSTDGKNWQEVNLNFKTIYSKINFIEWNGTRWLVGGSDSITGILYSSFDGIIWSIYGSYPFPQGANPNPIPVNKLIWNGSNFLAICENPQKAALGDVNGVWDTPVDLINKPVSVTWANKRWLIFGQDTVLAKASIDSSLDGKIWECKQIFNQFDTLSCSKSRPLTNTPKLKIPRNELIYPSTQGATTINIDCSLSNNVYFTVGTGTTAVIQTFSNLPPSYVLYKLTVILIQGTGGDNTISWDASVNWGTAGAPILTQVAGKRDIYELYTYNGGTEWLGSVKGQGY